MCARLVLGALALVARPLGVEAQASEGADHIIVLKSQRRLMLMRTGSVIAVFPIALGSRPTGPNRQQGDGRTPEGLYWVDGINPRSRFHRTLHISYPNEEDLRWAHAAGVSPGGNIEIHGMPNGYGNFDPVGFFKDWTNGCVAVGNRAIDQIYASVRIGTPVEIKA